MRGTFCDALSSDSHPVNCRGAPCGPPSGPNVGTPALWRRPRRQVILPLVSTESYGPRLADLRRRLVPAQGRPSMHEVRAPFTDEPLGHLPLCGEPEVAVAVRRARVAAAEWARVPPGRRTEPLQRFHEI